MNGKGPGRLASPVDVPALIDAGLNCASVLTDCTPYEALSGPNDS
jgi:hypothetical protein